MLKFRKAQTSLSIGSEVVFQATYRKYYGILLRFNLAMHRAEICMWDDVLNCWLTLWVEVPRLNPYNAKAETAEAIPA